MNIQEYVHKYLIDSGFTDLGANDVIEEIKSRQYSKPLSGKWGNEITDDNLQETLDVIADCLARYICLFK